MHTGGGWAQIHVQLDNKPGYYAMAPRLGIVLVCLVPSIRSFVHATLVCRLRPMVCLRRGRQAYDDRAYSDDPSSRSLEGLS